jgi:uncharacterized protein YbjT (DUF2867 family)
VTDQPRPQQLLVVGATGSIGREVVAAAQRHALPVRALVRDLDRAETLLPGTELIRGDLEDRASLSDAVHGADAIVFTHGTHGSADAARRVDYGGVANVLHALDGRLPRIVLMTSIYVTRPETYGGHDGLLGWKRRSERLVRASGAPHTIVRPSWFDRVGTGDRRLVLEQGDTSDGGIARDQLAEVIVRSVLTPTAVGKTFELFATAGDPPSDWDALFAALAADDAGALDGAADRATSPPLEQEPPAVREDISRLTLR